MDTLLAPWRARALAIGGLAAAAIVLLGAMAIVALRAGNRERAALLDARELSRELTVALERERTMRSELLHRTKNNLAMMMAMLTVEGRRANGNHDAFLATANRISALALAQEALDQPSATGDIECSAYLTNIASVLANAEPRRKVSLSLSLETITLPAGRAQALGLIANELITNSLKYAFGDRPTGTVTLELHAVDDRVIFAYRDDGRGFEGEPRRGSKGLRLIEALCSTLSATHTVSGADGFRFTLAFPRHSDELVSGAPAAAAPRRAANA